VYSGFRCRPSKSRRVWARPCSSQITQLLLLRRALRRVSAYCSLASTVAWFGAVRCRHAWTATNNAVRNRSHACCPRALCLLRRTTHAGRSHGSGLCRSLLRVPPARRVVDAHNGAWLRVASDTLFRTCGCFECADARADSPHCAALIWSSTLPCPTSRQCLPSSCRSFPRFYLLTRYAQASRSDLDLGFGAGCLRHARAWFVACERFVRQLLLSTKPKTVVVVAGPAARANYKGVAPECCFRRSLARRGDATA